MFLRTIANGNLSRTYVFSSSKISPTQNKYNIRFGVSILQFYFPSHLLVHRMLFEELQPDGLMPANMLENYSFYDDKYKIIRLTFKHDNA